ncbi:MAG: HAD family hydrolase [Gammaproteobacteria bacterium]
MDTIVAPQHNTFYQQTIRANQLISAFEYYAPKIKVLSLDCFDTLIWRKTAAPMDVFYMLHSRPAFKDLHFSAMLRILSEDQTRKLKNVVHASNEISLEDIYTTAFPHLPSEQIQELVKEELAAEMEVCFGFPPVMELIRLAHARGIKIIIVSDTYLKQNQLQELLGKVLPPDIVQCIDTVFCSSEFGKSKWDGLFKFVLKNLNLTPESILHIGDNPVSDLAAALEQKIHGLHLIHCDEHVNAMLRMHNAYQSMTNPVIRYTKALIQPFKAILATADLSNDKCKSVLGYASLGPLMYAFANYLCQEVTALKAAGKNPKVAFLMRDAYLPHRACEAFADEPLGPCIRISRFSAIAASFRTTEDIQRYLGDVARSNRFLEISRQLQIPDAISSPIIDDALKSFYPAHHYTQLVLRQDIQKLIFENSAEYRRKLIKYLQKELNLTIGDTLIFVDLGYAGTAQLKLESVLNEELGIHIIGRYFISLSTPGWKYVTHQGMLDTSWCDERALFMLVNYIALFEQLCTSTESSTIGYDDEGNVLYAKDNIKEQQHNILRQIQDECILFIQDAKTFFNKTSIKLSMNELRESAMAELGRLLFLPTEDELNYLNSFCFDLNVGTSETFQLFDQKKGLSGLKKRGLFSLFLERHGKTYRPNSAAELRGAGIELSMALVNLHRYNLDLGVKDLTFYREKINSLIVRGNEVANTQFEATHTHDEYYSLILPLGNGDFQIAILFGNHYKWIQLESVELIKRTAYLTVAEAQNTQDYWSNMHFNQMQNHGDKLYECINESSFLMIKPSANLNNQYIVRIIFRPIVKCT